MKTTKTMMTRSLLAIGMIFGCVTSAQADITLLVDYSTGPRDANGQFADPDTGIYTPPVSVASDFAANDADVNLDASVNTLLSTELQDVSGTFIDATVESNRGGLFTSDNGLRGDQAIFAGYNTARGAANPITITVGSLEEFATGTDVTATFYSVGDAANQDGMVSYTYGDITTPIALVEAAAGADFNWFLYLHLRKT